MCSVPARGVFTEKERPVDTESARLLLAMVASRSMRSPVTQGMSSPRVQRTFATRRCSIASRERAEEDRGNLIVSPLPSQPLPLLIYYQYQTLKETDCEHAN